MFLTKDRNYKLMENDNLRDKFEKNISMIHSEINLATDKLNDLIFAMDGGYKKVMKTDKPRVSISPNKNN